MHAGVAIQTLVIATCAALQIPGERAKAPGSGSQRLGHGRRADKTQPRSQQVWGGVQGSAFLTRSLLILLLPTTSAHSLRTIATEERALGVSPQGECRPQRLRTVALGVG